MEITSSVIIPSWRRPQQLVRCLESLSLQTLPPDQVIVVWQADDLDTREAVESMINSFSCKLEIVHCLQAGVVPAENKGLEIAIGEVILLCDDDVVVPPTWVERHLSFYKNSNIGAVGGSANNHYQNGKPFPKRAVKPIGSLSWYGKCFGNMYDQEENFRQSEPIEVDHLVGYNMSLRRSAFNKFEESLKSYWQMFELDACMQVKSRGFKVMFDFANVVDHYPTNTAYTGGRNGDLQIKIFNASYNKAFILSKHGPTSLLLVRLLYLLFVGNTNSPGILLFPLCCIKYSRPVREYHILLQTLTHKIRGWQDGIQRRKVGKLSGAEKS